MPDRKAAPPPTCDCGHKLSQHPDGQRCRHCDCPYFAPSEFYDGFPYEDGVP